MDLGFSFHPVELWHCGTVGIELGPLDLHSKHLYLLSYQTDPVTSLLFDKAATIFSSFPFPMWF